MTDATAKTSAGELADWIEENGLSHFNLPYGSSKEKQAEYISMIVSALRAPPVAGAGELADELDAFLTNQYHARHTSIAEHILLQKISAALRSPPVAGPITTEQLDQLQFGKSLHERPVAGAEGGAREALDHMHEARLSSINAKTECARLRNALEPFAKISLWRDKYPDSKEDNLTDHQLQGYIKVADVRRARAALVSPSPVMSDHVRDDDLTDLVSRFSLALLEKLRAAKANGRSGWDRDDWEDQCRDGLVTHLEKGDHRDVAAYLAFLWHHDWPLSRVRRDTDALISAVRPMERLPRATIEEAKSGWRLSFQWLLDLRQKVERATCFDETLECVEETALQVEAILSLVPPRPMEREKIAKIVCCPKGCILSNTGDGGTSECIALKAEYDNLSTADAILALSAEQPVET